MMNPTTCSECLAPLPTEPRRYRVVCGPTCRVRRHRRIRAERIEAVKELVANGATRTQIAEALDALH